MNSFYTEDELNDLGLRSYGKNVLISRKASIYGAEEISIGDNVRIDDFCIISGKNMIGSYIHISAGAYCFGGSTGIYMGDYVAVSSRTAIYAESDDYSGAALGNSTIPNEFRNVISGKVVIGKYAMIGTGCTLLPGVTVGEGTAVGCMSLVNRSLDEWGMYVGIPCRRIKDRKKDLLDIEKEFLKRYTV
ncbi:MAG: acyltransferase [Lachnospiraceae bacterium]|nr:acyltransferase [Lachnospiraceae bacterium]